jgi:hypothetical protein
MWAAIFGLLAQFSLLTQLRRAIPWLAAPARTYLVVEVWVIGHSLMACAAAIFASATPHSWLHNAMLVYGALRVFEIVVTQINVLLFDEWRARRAGKSYALRGYRRILILLAHNYAEVVFWFALALLSFNDRTWLELDDPSVTTTLRSTLLAMVAFSTEGIRPIERAAATLLSVQALVGVLMTILTLARFLALMPTPASQEPTER